MTETRVQLQSNVKTYTPGSFWWTDVNVTDPEAAKAFYGPLLHWEFEDTPGEQGTYTLARRDGLTVAGMMELSQEMLDAGLSPFWLSYVNVDDIQVAAVRVRELGGSVMREPQQVGESGWMAPITDPTGAGLMLWQPLGHPGAEAINGPGALCWFSLMTSDTDAAAQFYSELFGWTAQPAEGDEMKGYNLFLRDGRPVAGYAGLMPGMEQSVWGLTLGVDDIDAALEHVQATDATVLFGPHDTPWGPMLTILDPQGATVTLCGTSAQMMD